MFPQRLDGDEKKLSLVLGSEAVDCDAVAETFLSYMGDRRATTYKQKARHVTLALETLQSRLKLKDGAEARCSISSRRRSSEPTALSRDF